MENDVRSIAESGARRTFLELPRFLFSSLAWLPDGRGMGSPGGDGADYPGMMEMQ